MEPMVFTQPVLMGLLGLETQLFIVEEPRKGHTFPFGAMAFTFIMLKQIPRQQTLPFFLGEEQQTRMEQSHGALWSKPRLRQPRTLSIFIPP